MVFFSGLGSSTPREVTQAPSFSNDGGWLLRFFDSAFFCEWIAVTYLYRHEHGGVRDYICNRMYTLPVAGLEDYLFQLCHMAVHKPSPSLEKFLTDTCAVSLRVSLKVYWFLQAEAEDLGGDEEILTLQERCQEAALGGNWPPLVCPRPPPLPLSGRGRVLRLMSNASRRLLPLSAPTHGAARPVLQAPPPPSAAAAAVPEEERSGEGGAPPLAADPDSSLTLLKKLMPGPKVQQMREAFLKKFGREEGKAVEDGEGEDGDGWRELLFRRYFWKGREEEEVEEGEEGEGSLDGAKSKDSVFFGKYFRKGVGERAEEGEAGEEKMRRGGEDGATMDTFFKRMWRDKKGLEDMDGDDETGSASLAEKGPSKSFKFEDDKFFRRLFGSRGDDLAPEDKKLIGELQAAVAAHGDAIDSDEKGFFRHLLGFLGGEGKSGKGEKGEGGQEKPNGEGGDGAGRSGELVGKGSPAKLEVEQQGGSRGGKGGAEEQAAKGFTPKEEGQGGEVREDGEGLTSRMAGNKEEQSAGSEAAAAGREAEDGNESGQSIDALVAGDSRLGSGGVQAKDWGMGEAQTADGGTHAGGYSLKSSSGRGATGGGGSGVNEGSSLSGDAPATTEPKFLKRLLFRRSFDEAERGFEKGGEKAFVERSELCEPQAASSLEAVEEDAFCLQRTASGRDESEVARESRFLRKLRNSIANAAGAAMGLTHQGGAEEGSLKLPPSSPARGQPAGDGLGQEGTGEGARPGEGLNGGDGGSRKEGSEGAPPKAPAEDAGAANAESRFLRKLFPSKGPSLGAPGGSLPSSTSANSTTGSSSESSGGEPDTPKPLVTTPRKDRPEREDSLSVTPGQPAPSSTGFLRRLWREKGDEGEGKGLAGGDGKAYVPLVDASPPASAGEAAGSGQKASPPVKAEGGSRLSFMGNPLKGAALLVSGSDKVRRDAVPAEGPAAAAQGAVAGAEPALLRKGRDGVGHLAGSTGAPAVAPKTPPPKKAISGLLPLVRSLSNPPAEMATAKPAPAGEPRPAPNGFSSSISLPDQGCMAGPEGKCKVGAEMTFGPEDRDTVVASGRHPCGQDAREVAAPPLLPMAQPAKAPQSAAGKVGPGKAAAVAPEPQENEVAPTEWGTSSAGLVGQGDGLAHGATAGLQSGTGAAGEEGALENCVVGDPATDDKGDEGVEGKSTGGEHSPPKPPLPRYPAFKIRQGTFHASLDFVKALCDISLGLVHVFPLADRQKALKESLAELNAHLEAGIGHGGVCFPMGKQLSRIVHMPVEEAILLNSRERVPFMVFVEVLRCDPLSSRKNEGEAVKRGIPLAKGDAKLPRPPPWALYMYNARGEMGGQARGLGVRPSGQELGGPLGKVKVVDVALEVKRRKGRKGGGRRKEGQQEGGGMSSGAGAREDGCGASEEAGCQSDRREEASESGEASTSAGACCGERGERGAGGGEESSTSGRGAEGEGRWIGGGRLRASLREGVVNTGDRGGAQGAMGRQGEERKNSRLEVRRQDSERSEEDKDECMSETSGSDGSESSGEWEEAEEWEEWVSVKLVAVPGVTMDDVAAMVEQGKEKHRRVPSGVAMAQVQEAAAKGNAPKGLPLTSTPATSQQETKASRAGMERLAERKARIRKASKYGTSPDWDLKSMIVKSGDDCRQEHLAVQLAAHMLDIFKEAGLPLWLRPFEVIVTSSDTALIETIPDAMSIHTLKSRHHLSSLREYFCLKFKEGSEAFRTAQQNFVESMAGYSILSYIMQVKDRHNGNIMIDSEGHIIHIDFGFMLSNSPGGVNFENAPFKLTREFLEVMDSDAEGTPSEALDYFKVLCIQGFLTVRKHSERILLLVEMMQNSGCNCFKSGPRTVHNLRKRFHLTLTEEHCVTLVLSLINSSLDAWRTRQYDYYQRVLNGIL